LPVSAPRSQAVDDDGEWNVPIATIDGRFVLNRDWDIVQATAVLEHVDQEIKTLQYNIPYRRTQFIPDSRLGHFAFAMSTCENYNPEYDLTLHLIAGNTDGDGFIGQLSTHLRARDGEHYETAFYPDEECSDSDYFTSYGIDEGICNFYDIAVSCFDQPGYGPARLCEGGGSWEASYPGYVYHSVKQTRDGDFIVAADGGSFVVRRINSLGSVRWTYDIILGFNGRDGATDVAETIDGNFIAVGLVEDNSSSTAGPSYDIYLVKLNQEGEVVWDETIGSEGSSEIANAIQETEDGDFVITGSLDGELLVMGIDSDGNEMWQNKIDVGSGWSNGDTIELIDGEYVISGVSTGYNVVLRTNESGDIIWQNDFGDFASSLFVLTRVGTQFVAAGSARQDGSDDGFVASINPDGSVNWQHSFGDPGSAFYSVTGTSDNGIVLTGFTDSHMWLMRLDHDGNLVWSREHYESSAGYSVRQTFDGGFIIAGSVEMDGTYYAWLVKTDSEGNFE